jgi:sterol desaturase/sphingolipid hydroxylase (fatty acid hydroxylase superfamily)
MTGLSILLIFKRVVPWVCENLNIQLIELHLFELNITEPFLQFAVAFVLIDFSRYCLHFAHHRIPFLWSFHRVHHSSEVLDATSGLRMHFVDFIQLSLLPIFWFYLIIDVSSWADWVVPSALGIGVVFDAFQHSNMRFDLNRPLNRAWHRIFNNPHFHIWHHTRDATLCDGNYGNTLLIWDRIFRTEVTQSNIPPLLGITSDQALKNDLLSLQLLRKKYP